MLLKHSKIKVGNANKWEAALAAGGSDLFDSEEEVFVLRWLEEARDAGYVEGFNRSQSWKIFDAVKGFREWVNEVRGAKRVEVRETTFLRERSYTPDFAFRLTQKFVDEFLSVRDVRDRPRCIKLATVLAGHAPDDLLESQLDIVCDVKGGFVLADRREEFQLKRHAMFMRYGIMVTEIDPAVLFALTWVPRAAAFTAKTGKRKTAFANCRFVDGTGAVGSSLIPEVEDGVE